MSASVTSCSTEYGANEVVQGCARRQQDGHHHRDAGRNRNLNLGQSAQQGGQQQGGLRSKSRVLVVASPVGHSAKTGERQGRHGEQQFAAQPIADTTQQRCHSEGADARGRTPRTFPLPAFAFRAHQKANRQRSGQSKGWTLSRQHVGILASVRARGL